MSPPERPPAQKVPIPWTLLWLLLTYAALVTGWVAHRFWTSPEYQAAVAYEEAWSILGKDGGRSIPTAELERAFRQLLIAGYAMPQVKTIHEDLESLRWRYAERRVPLPQPLEFGAEEASRRYRKIEDAREPILVIGLRNRGWEPATLVEGPATVLLWATILGVLGALLWLYFWWERVQARWNQREENLVAVEQELVELGKFRNRG